MTYDVLVIARPLLSSRITRQVSSCFVQGVLQEKLSTRHYAPDNKRFSEVIFINFAQSLACFVWAGMYLLVTRGFRSDAAPSWQYWRVGVSNTIGPALGVVALKNIR